MESILLFKTRPLIAIKTLPLHPCTPCNRPTVCRRIKHFLVCFRHQNLLSSNCSVQKYPHLTSSKLLGYDQNTCPPPLYEKCRTELFSSLPSSPRQLRQQLPPAR